nr:hypothetical protein [uncultured Pedobacter sp.]
MRNLELLEMDVQSLKIEDQMKINGDGFIGDYLLSKCLDYVIEGAYYMGQVGGAYQQSLPSNLKK